MSAPPPKKTGLSLYADLLDPDKKPQGATISGAPVKYEMKRDVDEEAQKKKDASLKFQPIKRPQVQQKTKPKVPPSSSSHKFSSSTATLPASSPEKQLPNSTPQQQPSVHRSNFEDWVGDEDDDYYYHDRNRGMKKKKKKNKGHGQETRTWDWDDVYDPTLPNAYADYKASEEQYREIRDWKARLYYHMREANRQSKNGAAYSDEDGESSRPMNRMFAPPSNFSFAPPSLNDDARPPPPPIDDDDDYYPPPSHGRRDSDSHAPPAPLAQIPVHHDATGEDAYMRRMRMSGMTPEQPTPPPPPAGPMGLTPTAPSIPTPPPVTKTPDPDLEAKRAAAQVKIDALKARLQKKPPTTDAPAVAPPQAVVESSTAAITSQLPPPPPPPPVEEPGTTISRAPVRYERPPPPPDLPGDEDMTAEDSEGRDTTSGTEQPKSSRPGQKGFAERLLKKYGWEKGKGLGVQGEGITTALVGKVDKRKKLADAQGGGWAQPANMGKIIGGKRRKIEGADSAEQDDARFGTMSDVIKLEGMLNGLDVQKEIEENNLMQEIGDEMAGQYGNVERVYIWREQMGGGNEVFVKFTSQLSALRAVNGMDGVTFAENEVVARFWDGEKFEKGEYA